MAGRFFKTSSCHNFPVIFKQFMWDIQKKNALRAAQVPAALMNKTIPIHHKPETVDSLSRQGCDDKKKKKKPILNDIKYDAMSLGAGFGAK